MTLIFVDLKCQGRSVIKEKKRWTTEMTDGEDNNIILNVIEIIIRINVFYPSTP